MKKLFFVILLIVSIRINAGINENSVLLEPSVEVQKTELIADKRNGLIYLIQTGQSPIVSPALYGKDISDDVSMWERAKITPAGTYVLEKAWSPKMKSYVMIFLHGKKQVAAIHPVYLGSPREQRMERLTNGSNGDERITNGCINVSPEFFNLLDMLSKNSPIILKVLKEDEKYIP